MEFYASIVNVKQVNRDPISNEMLKMRQQLEYLQAELCARGGGASSDEVQVLWFFAHEFLFLVDF